MQGTMQSPPPMPQPGMPPQPPPMYGPPMPTPKASHRVALVIVAIVVALIVVFAAVYFVFLASPGKPTVQFGTPIGSGSGFVVQVTSVSQSLPASSYRANLLVGSASGTATPLALFMNITVTGDVYTALWGDLNYDNRVTAGDAFGVFQSNGSLPNAVITFQLLWSDGSVVGSVSYQESGGTKPVISLSSPNPSTYGFSFVVAGVSQSRPISNFRVNILVDFVPGVAVTLSPSMTFTVSGTTYTVAYTDIGGEGDLNAGDTFDFSTPGGLTSGTTYDVLILWSDGSQLADASYTA